MIEHVVNGEGTARLIIGTKSSRLPLLRHQSRIVLPPVIHG